MQFNLRNLLPKYVSMLLTRPKYCVLTLCHAHFLRWSILSITRVCTEFSAPSLHARVRIPRHFKQYFCILFHEGPWQTV